MIFHIKSLHWQFKLLIKLLLSFLPFPYSFWRLFGLFKHGQMETSSYSSSVFEKHISFLPSDFLKGKLILEIGPGDLASTSLLSYKYGASSILIDCAFYVSTDLNLYLDLASDFGISCQHVLPLSRSMSFASFLSCFHSKYFVHGLNSLRSIPTASVDFAFSQAVLEHIPRSQFREYFDELFRVLKPGSITSHQIDLKDHLSYSLNNLRFSPIIWESRFFQNLDFYTNRLRFSEYVSIFESVGFKVDVTSVNRWESLPVPFSELHSQFQCFDLDDLLIKDFDVVLTRP